MASRNTKDDNMEPDALDFSELKESQNKQHW